MIHNQRRNLITTAVVVLFLFSTEAATAQTPIAPERPAEASSSSSGFFLKLETEFGMAPTNIGSVLWSIEPMIGFPLLGNRDILWAGIVPVIVPKFVGDQGSGTGFTPITIEYDHQIANSQSRPFLYASAGAGPQFGDYSSPVYFRTLLFSTGIGLREGGNSGFTSEAGLTYTNIRTTGAKIFAVLNSGIYF
jgi:hypothetical protein